MIATQPANQWVEWQFWNYVILLSDMAKEDLRNRGEEDLEWMVEGSVLMGLLNNSCPAGNA
jgi:hypothetical protein